MKPSRSSSSPNSPFHSRARGNGIRLDKFQSNGEGFCSGLPVDGSEPKVLSSEDHFSHLKRKFGKVYGSHEKHHYRFSVFRANLWRAVRHQKMDPSASHGVTQFSDLSLGEIIWGLMVGLSFPVTLIKLRFSLLRIFPMNLIGEIVVLLLPSRTRDLVGLAGVSAPQVLLKCDPEQAGSCDSGCNGGLMNSAFEYTLKTGGLIREEDYPYTGTDVGSCKLDKSKIVASVSNFSVVSTNED